MMGDDPHFSIMLPNGKLLCYTVQGEHGFAFNLISNNKIQMNARFVPDSRREEVTWMGSMGIVVPNKNGKGNGTKLRFEAQDNMMFINDKVILKAKNIEKVSLKGGKLRMSEAPQRQGYTHPEVLVDLEDVGLSFSVRFMSEHLDLMWRSTGVQMPQSHGLVGE